MNKEYRTEDINKVVSYINTYYNYGDLIYKNSIESLLGIDSDTPVYFYIMSKTKEKLLELNKVLVTVTNEGYKILEPNEITDYVLYNKLPKLKYNIKNSKNILKATPTQLLNKKELEYYQSVYDTLENITKDFNSNILKMQVKIGKINVRQLQERGE